jgi:hypothetical protein
MKCSSQIFSRYFGYILQCLSLPKLQYKISILIFEATDHIGRVFLESVEDEEEPELKGSMTASLCFRGEFISERVGGITTRTLTMSAMC